MALTTSLAGRVRNTSLPKSHALLPLLEAVVNGIQAIDARFGDDMEPGRLSIRIRRSQQEALNFNHVGPGRVALKPIVGFSVEDNGVGFTPENMTSFETLDSDHKAGMGCRGVGRLLWLKKPLSFREWWVCFRWSGVGVGFRRQGRGVVSSLRWRCRDAVGDGVAGGA
ncbi:hypothetical protein [Streptomyces zhihengii]